MKRKKYAFGGKEIKIQSPYQHLMESKKNTQEAKMEAAQNVQGLNMAASVLGNLGSSMMSKGYAGMGKQDGMTGFMQEYNGDINSLLSMMQGMNFAFGGKVPNVPVEVEGKEVAETPLGELIEFKGPSHEKGGIDVNLPEGTDVFSKRIKLKGKTMAERKKAREKKVMSLEKLLENNKNDKVIKDTIKRTKRNNKIEEQEDMFLQQLISLSKSNNSGKQEFKDGGTVIGNLLRSIFGGKNKGPGGVELLDFDKIDFNTDASLNAGISDSTLTKGINDFSYADSFAAGKNPDEPQLPSEGFGLPKLTMGDSVGLLGTLYSTFAPMANTKEQRAGDTPNINAFEDYGKEGLDIIAKTKDYIKGQRDDSLSDLQLSKNAASSKNRNSARGVNTMRALDLALNAQTNKAEGDIYNNFAQQMMSIMNQEAAMENEQDRIVMQGEKERDLADRMDRDNYYSQLAQDIATKGQGIQQFGKLLNDNRENTMAEKAVNDSSINFKYDKGVLKDKAGNVVMTKGEINKAAKAIGVTPEEYIEMLKKYKG